MKKSDNQAFDEVLTKKKSSLRQAINPTVAVAATVGAVLMMIGVGGYLVGYTLGDSNNGPVMGRIDKRGDDARPGGLGMDENNTLGVVLEVTSGSIKVKNPMQDEAKTYTINDDTSTTDADEDASASDIEVGDTVMVEANDDDSSIAEAIHINPPIGRRHSVAPKM